MLYDEKEEKCSKNNEQKGPVRPIVVLDLEKTDGIEIKSKGLLKRCDNLNITKFINVERFSSLSKTLRDESVDDESLSQFHDYLKPVIFKDTSSQSLYISLHNCIKNGLNFDRSSLSKFKKEILQTNYYRLNFLKDPKNNRIYFDESDDETPMLKVSEYRKQKSPYSITTLTDEDTRIKNSLIESDDKTIRTKLKDFGNTDLLFCERKKFTSLSKRLDYIENDELKKQIYYQFRKYFENCFTYLPNLDNETCTDKNVVGLLFSGGKDSTCRLLELLINGESVVPIINSFNIHEVESNLIRDISAINTIYRLYEQSDKYKGKLYRPVMSSYIGFRFTHNFGGFSQQQYNAISLSLLGENYLKRFKRIEFCLIMSDQTVSFIDDIKKVYTNGMKMNMLISNDDLKIPPLVFPYVKLHKSTICSRLNNYIYKIFGDTYHTLLREPDNNLYIPTGQFLSISSIYIVNYIDRYNRRDNVTLCLRISDDKDDDIKYREEDDVVIRIPLTFVPKDKVPEGLMGDNHLLTLDKIAHYNSGVPFGGY